MDILDILRLAVLAVLAGPLLAAALVGRMGQRPARRTAAACAVAHLFVTALVCLLAVGLIAQRDEARDVGAPPAVAFDPVVVPGAVGDGTSWSLLTVGPTVTGRPAPDVQLYLGFDGLNVWLVLLTSLLTLVAVWASWDGIADRAGAYFAWLFALETCVIGAFLSFDVLLFYVFFELTLIPVFFLIGHWGVGANRREAARKFFLYTLFGSLFTLAGLVGAVLTNPTPLDPNGSGGKLGDNIDPYQPGKGPVPDRVAGPVTFSIPRLMRNVQTWNLYYPAKAKQTADAVTEAERKLAEAMTRAAGRPDDPALVDADHAAKLARQKAAAAADERDQRSTLQVWLFFALMAGFAVKTPVVPFHTWLPAAYSEAPMAVTMMLSAILAKLGTFGMLRVVVPLTPDAAFLYGLPVFGVLGAAGIVYAALCAYAQRDAKLLVAYSSVSHLGLLVLGLFALNREGVSGAVLHMVNHGLSVGALFALLGFLHDRYRTLDMNQYGGLIGRYPGYAVLFFVVALAGIGLPGLNNFVSEMLLMAGLFDPVHTQSMGGYWLPAVAAFGVFLSSWYVITMLRRVFFGPAQEPAVPGVSAPIRSSGMASREALAYGIPAVLCVALGVYPQPLLDTIRADAEVVVNIVDVSRDRFKYDKAPKPPAPEKPKATAPAAPAKAPAAKKPKAKAATPATGKGGGKGQTPATGRAAAPPTKS